MSDPNRPEQGLTTEQADSAAAQDTCRNPPPVEQHEPPEHDRAVARAGAAPDGSFVGQLVVSFGLSNGLANAITASATIGRGATQESHAPMVASTDGEGEPFRAPTAGQRATSVTATAGPARASRFRPTGLLRAALAGALVGLVAYALCHAHGRGVLCGRIHEHVLASLMYAGLVLVDRWSHSSAGFSTSELWAELKRELRPALGEGLLFGTLTALIKLIEVWW